METEGLVTMDGKCMFHDSRLEALFNRSNEAAERKQWISTTVHAALWATSAAICLSQCTDTMSRLRTLAIQLLCFAASMAVTVWAFRQGSIACRLQLWSTLLHYVESFRRNEEHEAHASLLAEELDEVKHRERVLYEQLFRGQRRVPGQNWTGRRDFLLAAPESACISPAEWGSPELAIPLALSDQLPDWDAAVRAASRIRDPSYGLLDFYVDVRRAFPELQLYTALLTESKEGHTDVSSGFTRNEEYHRAIGSLFAVYWLARLGIDGERGFSFGVDDEWVPRQPPTAEALESSPELQMRMQFYEHQEWEGLQQLLRDARMLRGEDGSLDVDVEMMTAMLVLCAMHEVFKVEALLPRVLPEHAPFHGFAGGDVINDHDLALYYVLACHPSTLPSFSRLNQAQKRSVLFTQSKLSFNHGWLLQAEATPHALFANLKRVVAAGEAGPADMSFYFVHWLTDLAGAQPTPLDGSEKLVLAFPHHALCSFIRSFHVLSDLATDTETQVYESHLENYWEEIRPELGLSEPPEGKHAIALMRLVCQAQTPDRQLAILQAWEHLGPEDQQVLCDEMSRTGFADQLYERSPSSSADGPAFLIYYSPQLLRTLAPDTALEALNLLAEIYRRARELWPLEPVPLGADEGSDDLRTVTIRVDQLKKLSMEHIRQVYANNNSWLLCKRNAREAVVECHSIDYIAEQGAHGAGAAVLKLWRRK